MHAGSFRVFVIHQTLTRTAGSLTCICDYSCVYAYTLGLGTPTASQHNIFDSEKLTIFFCTPDGIWTWVTDVVIKSWVWRSTSPSPSNWNWPTLKPVKGYATLHWVMAYHWLATGCRMENRWRGSLLLPIPPLTWISITNHTGLV